MFVDRKELFSLLGVPHDFKEGSHLILEAYNGSRRATISWNGNDFSADVMEIIEGEASEPIVTLNGRWAKLEDGFDLTARDERLEASDRHDAKSAANAIHMLASDMNEVLRT